MTMTTRTGINPTAPQAPSTSPLVNYLKPLVASETWSATGFLLASLFVGTWWFALVLLVGVAGLATLIIGVGVPLLAATAAVARSGADLERGRVAAIGVDLPTDHHRPPGGLGRAALLRWELGNKQTGRNLGYLLLLFLLGPIWFSLTVVAWTVPLSFVATPLMLALGFEPTASSVAGGWEISIDSMPVAVLIAAAGAVMLPLAPRLVMAMARSQGRMAERLLTPVPGSDGAETGNADGEVGR